MDMSVDEPEDTITLAHLFQEWGRVRLPEGPDELVGRDPRASDEVLDADGDLVALLGAGGPTASARWPELVS